MKGIFYGMNPWVLLVIAFIILAGSFLMSEHLEKNVQQLREECAAAGGIVTETNGELVCIKADK